MKKIKITEDQLKRIIEDDLFEYAWLGKRYTGLDVDVFVDDGGAYKRYGHPLWVYVRDGYDENAPAFHIEVSETPKPPKVYNIRKIDMDATLTFISLNAELLKSFADGDIEHEEFYESCKPVIYSYNTVDSRGYINEMSTLKPEQSGLPTVVWIDEGTSPQHGPRIKFRVSKEQATTRQFTTMSISQFPEIKHLPKKRDLSNRDIHKIKEFVKANEKLLLMVCGRRMTYQDFLKQMVKV